MHLLRSAQIDYYTRWDHATGKGRGTEQHLATGPAPRPLTMMELTELTAAAP